MKKQEFLNLIRSKIIFLDGATGTELAKLGMPHGICPEAWVVEHPDTIATIQKNYEQAGSDIVYACTFGANRIKLANYGLENDVIAMGPSVLVPHRRLCSALSSNLRRFSSTLIPTTTAP